MCSTLLNNMAHSWHQPPRVHGGLFVFGLAFVFSADGQARDAVEIVTVIFPLPADEKVLFFVYKVPAVVFAHFKIRGKLNGIGRARLFAETAKNTARKIDPEELGVPPAVFILR